MECRSNCGACCIALSISEAIPGMPNGKPAGVRCIHLNDDYTCNIFGQDNRPNTCCNFMPELDFCGNSQAEALKIQKGLEESLSS